MEFCLSILNWWQFRLSDTPIFQWRTWISWNSRPLFLCWLRQCFVCLRLGSRVCVLLVFSFVLGNNKQHCSWSWIDAMVSLISRWILTWWCWLVKDRWELFPWRRPWSIADDGCGYGWAVYLRWAKCWRNNRLFLWGSGDFSETVICFWKLRMFQRSLDFIFPLRCLEHRSLLVNTTYSTNLTLKVWRSSYWICIWVCIEKWMSCRKGVWKFVPLWGATWHWCDLTFIEPSVVKVDYGKMSASDLSSLEIALWYLELQEMIWDIDLWVWVNLHGAQAILNTDWSFI